jgi:hypothetical protein
MGTHHTPEIGPQFDDDFRPLRRDVEGVHQGRHM